MSHLRLQSVVERLRVLILKFIAEFELDESRLRLNPFRLNGSVSLPGFRLAVESSDEFSLPVYLRCLSARSLSIFLFIIFYLLSLFIIDRVSILFSFASLVR